MFDTMSLLGEDIKIAEITIKNKKLIVIYCKVAKHLANRFESDEEMENSIINNINEAFDRSIEKIKNGVYVLNIASTDNFGDFTWKDDTFSKELLNGQLSIFMPIIQKFILEAKTDTLSK